MSDVVQANPLDGNADNRVKAGSGSGAGVEPMDVELAIVRKDAGAQRGIQCTPVRLVFAVLLCIGAGVGLFFAGRASADAGSHGSVHWSYAGEGRPANWGDLEPAFAICSSGTRQSPINIITSDVSIASPPVALSYNYDSLDGGKAQLQRGPGHPGFKVVPVPAQPADKGLTVDGDVYRLLQFHFHSPSEHTLNGLAYPLEMHMVHQNAAGQLAVLGMMFEIGSTANSFLSPFWSDKAENGATANGVDLTAMLNTISGQNYYRYNGSLTTPPCSEGVKWLLAQTTAKASEAQVQSFVDAFNPNARPVQPRNSRTVLGYQQP